MTCQIASIAGLIALLGGSAPPAAAEPFFQVRLRENSSTQVEQSGADGVSLSDVFTMPGRTAQVAGSAQPTGLSASAITTSESGSYGSGSEATMRFDDLVVTNLLDPGDTTPIDARLRFEVHGGIQLGLSGGGSSPLNSNGRLIVGYRLGDVTTSAGQIWLNTDPDTNQVVLSGAFTGLANPEAVSGVFTTTADIELEVGVPQTLELELEVIANVGNLLPNTNVTAVDFSDGLSFPTDGSPVLVLPEGYTADAPSAGIAGNVFAAPEPDAAAAAFTALLVLLGLRWRPARLGVVVLIAASAVACGPFAKLRKDLARLDTNCVIRGAVRGATAGGGKVYVAVIRVTTPDLVEIADVTALDAGQMGFAFLLPKADDYWIAAFQDQNGDQIFQPGEPFWVYGAPGPVPIGPDHASALLDVQLSTAPPKVAPEMIAAVRHARRGRTFVSLTTGDSIPIAVGEVAADLDAPRFSQQNGTLGLWQPVTFLTQLGVGVYFVEPYDPKRVPVLFVNGAGGSPQNFRHFFPKLDTTKYQAWFFLYPSGMRLAESSRVLGRVVDELHGELGFARLDVVAHSMGGLVARRFLLDALAAERPWVYNFATLSTPWSGHPAAALGVKYAPAVIPSWRDMEVGSPFTTDLFEQKLAPPLTYCLGFTFHGKKGIGLPQDNDGAVGVASELRPEAQDEAVRMRGFDLTHTGVLQSDDAFAFIENCLDREAQNN